MKWHREDAGEHALLLPHLNTGGLTTALNLFPKPQDEKERGLKEKGKGAGYWRVRGINVGH